MHNKFPTHGGGARMPDCRIGICRQHEQPVVEFIATGGTIAMKIDPVKHAPVPAISG